MRFATLITFVAAASAVRLHQSTSTANDEAVPDWTKRPTVQQIFDFCDANDDETLTMHEFIDCSVKISKF